MSSVVFPLVGKTTAIYLSICHVPGILYIVHCFIKYNYPLRNKVHSFHFSNKKTEAQEVKQFTQGHRWDVVSPTLVFLTPKFIFFSFHHHRVIIITTLVLVHDKPKRM